MKRTLLLLFLILTLTACNNDPQISASAPVQSERSDSSAERSQDPQTSLPQASDRPIDLTVMSGTMVYAEVYQMMVQPDDYLGREVTMQGVFSVYEGTNRNYYACVIADAAACCSQGIEFVLEEPLKYPEEYPESGSEIKVQGIFDTYEEEGYSYCQLIHAKLLS